MIAMGMTDSDLVRTAHGDTNPKTLGAWLNFNGRPIFAYVRQVQGDWVVQGYRTLEEIMALATSPNLPTVVIP